MRVSTHYLAKSLLLLRFYLVKWDLAVMFRGNAVIHRNVIATRGHSSLQVRHAVKKLGYSRTKCDRSLGLMICSAQIPHICVRIHPIISEHSCKMIAETAGGRDAPQMDGSRWWNSSCSVSEGIFLVFTMLETFRSPPVRVHFSCTISGMQTQRTRVCVNNCGLHQRRV